MKVITSPAVSQGPLFALGAPGGRFGSDLIEKLLLVVVLLDILAVYVGAAVASTRGTFAMARDRRLPVPLAAVAERYGTPVGANVTLLVVQGLLILAAEAGPDSFLDIGLPHYFSVFIWCATFGGFALLVVYLLMAVGALRGLADVPNKAALWISAILGIAITGGGIFGSFYKVTSPTLLAPWSALIWGAVGLVYMLAVKGREPASQALADLHSGEGATTT
jgi:amino acid transporter